MAVPPGEPVPPADPWYRRRYWVYPYPGCGCLWTLLMFMLIWWLLSLLFAPLAFWSRPVRPVEPVEPVELRSVPQSSRFGAPSAAKQLRLELLTGQNR